MTKQIDSERNSTITIAPTVYIRKQRDVLNAILILFNLSGTIRDKLYIISK